MSGFLDSFLTLRELPFTLVHALILSSVNRHRVFLRLSHDAKEKSTLKRKPGLSTLHMANSELIKLPTDVCSFQFKRKLSILIRSLMTRPSKEHDGGWAG